MAEEFCSDTNSLSTTAWSAEQGFLRSWGMILHDQEIHSPSAPTSACSPEKTCPPTPPKFLTPELGGCLHPVSLKCRQRGGAQFVPEGLCGQRTGMGLGEEEGVLLQTDQRPVFSFSAQAIPGHFTWITQGE